MRSAREAVWAHRQVKGLGELIADTRSEICRRRAAHPAKGGAEELLVLLRRRIRRGLILLSSAAVGGLKQLVQA